MHVLVILFCPCLVSYVAYTYSQKHLVKQGDTKRWALFTGTNSLKVQALVLSKRNNTPKNENSVIMGCHSISVTQVSFWEWQPHLHTSVSLEISCPHSNLQYRLSNTVCMDVQQESSPYSLTGNQSDSNQSDSDQSNIKGGDVHKTEKSFDMTRVQFSLTYSSLYIWVES